MNALFFDFDGTLRVPQTDKITSMTLHSLQKAKQNGNLLMINTGRSYFSLSHAIQGVPVHGCICGCGTYIRYRGKVLYQKELQEHYVQRVLEALRQYHVDAFLEGHQGMYVDHVYSSKMDQILNFFHNVGMEVKKGSPDHPFSKMSLYYKNKAQKEEFEHQLIDIFDFIHYPALQSEAVLKGHSKGRAMRKLMDILQLPMNASYAFGDSENDEEMLKEAQTSILLGDQAKHLAKHVTLRAPCAKDEGITWALKTLHII